MWTELFKSTDLVEIIRIMKLAIHIGFWKDYVIETEFGINNQTEKAFPPQFGSIIPIILSPTSPDIFQPVVTDYGHCLAANTLDMGQMLKDGHPFKRVFLKAFEEELKENSTARNSVKVGRENGMSFYIDSQARTCVMCTTKEAIKLSKIAL